MLASNGNDVFMLSTRYIYLYCDTFYFSFAKGENRYKFEESNPFITDDEEVEVASVAYRYRKWDLDNGIILICRCEHDGVLLTPNVENQFLTIKALNEWDSKVIFS